MTLYTPSPELVAVAWLRSLHLPLVSDVSTTLPAPEKWTQSCYVQASDAGGVADAYDPRRSALIRVDVWSGPKKFGDTNSVAQLIEDAIEDEQNMHREMSVRAGNFRSVRLVEVAVWQPPRAVRGDGTSVYSSQSLRGGATTGVRSYSPASDPSKTVLAHTTMLLALLYQIVRS